MACDITTTLAAACTSGIGKLTSRIPLLQTWAQLVCTGGGCPALSAPVATATTLNDVTSFQANWNAVVGAVTYYIDVSTDPAFGSFVPGWEGAYVGAPSISALVTGLTENQTYYYRVRASALTPGQGCESANSNVITSATTFDPLTISLMEVWVKSDTGVYQDAGKTIPCTDGTTCAAWDNMGNGTVLTDFVQATAGKRPTFNTAGGANGRPRLSFNASRMDITLSILQPYTIAIAMKATSGSASPCSILWNAGGASVQFGFTTSAALFPYVYAGGGFQPTSITSQGNVPGQIMALVKSAGLSFIKSNSTKVNDITGGPTLSTPGLMGYASGGTFDVIGDVYEVMIWSKELSGAEETSVFNYLKTRYALP